MSDRESLCHPQPYNLRLWHYAALCAALFANEVAVTFELIYMVTLEKLLGLPHAYVSLPGVISASVGLFLCPIMGKFGDGGNRFRRKSLLVVTSALLQASGAAILLVASVIRIVTTENIHDSNNSSYQNCTVDRPNSTLEAMFKQSLRPAGNHSAALDGLNMLRVETACNVSSLRLINLETDETLPVHNGSLIPAVLGLISFALMDLGFDTGSSNIRAFMLECVDQSWHSKVLSVGILMSGLGGCVFSVLGLPDYGPLFRQENHPSLSKAIFLSIFLIVSVAVTFPITLFFGTFLRRKLELSAFTSDMNLPVLKTNVNSEHTRNGVPNTEKLKTGGETNSDASSSATTVTCCRAVAQKLSRFIILLKRKATSYRFVALALVCLATFWGSFIIITFEVYSSNFLAEGVYGGQADAPAGSELRRRFEEGMITASRGTLLFEAVFFLYNFCHHKVSEKIGLIPESLLGSAVTIPLIIAFALSKEVPVYYVLAVANGVYRTLFFSTPFILATETIDEIETTYLLQTEEVDSHIPNSCPGVDSSEQEAGQAAHGYTISVVYTMIPFSYLLISALMGPLLVVTNDPAIPLYFGAVGGIASACAMLVLAFVKRKRMS